MPLPMVHTRVSLFSCRALRRHRRRLRPRRWRCGPEPEPPLLEHPRQLVRQPHALDLGKIGRVLHDAVPHDARNGDADRIHGFRSAPAQRGRSGRPASRPALRREAKSARPIRLSPRESAAACRVSLLIFKRCRPQCVRSSQRRSQCWCSLRHCCRGDLLLSHSAW